MLLEVKFLMLRLANLSALLNSLVISFSSSSWHGQLLKKKKKKVAREFSNRLGKLRFFNSTFRHYTWVCFNYIS